MAFNAKKPPQENDIKNKFSFFIFKLIYIFFLIWFIVQKVEND